ncbi:hypothetical protein Droror1_Dr00015056 [Drosera rotundifolia]
MVKEQLFSLQARLRVLGLSFLGAGYSIDAIDAEFVGPDGQGVSRIPWRRGKTFSGIDINLPHRMEPDNEFVDVDGNDDDDDIARNLEEALGAEMNE